MTRYQPDLVTLLALLLVVAGGCAPGAAGDRAGLKTGDVIVTVNREPVPGGAKAVKQLDKLLQNAAAAGPVSMSARRGATLLDASLEPDRVCDYPVLLGDDDALNAYADGNNIIITRGMMRFFESDRELALVIGHELAHNSMHGARDREAAQYPAGVAA